MGGEPSLEALDAALVRQLGRRATLATAQRGDPTDLIRSADSVALRRLVAVSHPGLTAQAIVRIWRELQGAAAPVKLAVWPSRDPARILDLTRLSFGGAAPITLAVDAEAALAAAAAPGGAAVIALDAERPWWGRLLAQPALKVFAALPCLSALGETSALAVGLAAPEPTGRDQTFWVTDAPGPPAAIAGVLAADGVAAEVLASAGGLKLFALAGFYQAADPRLTRGPGRLSGVIGAASTPLDV